MNFDGTFNYAYDNNGNRIARWIDDSDGVLDAGDTDITEYAWDHRNRLITVTDRATYSGSATQTVEYDYDYMNQLVSRTLDADGNPGTTGDIQQTRFAYDNGQVVLQFEKTGTGTLTASDLSNRYLWGTVVDQLLADEEIDWTDNEANGEALWALADHLGSIRDQVGETGTVQSHKVFDTFGNTTNYYPYQDVVFAFTGKLLDDATDLQNNLHRWYDANVGSWMSEDPIGFAGGDANLNRYVGNMPTMFVDPSGLLGVQEPWNWGPFHQPKPPAERYPIGDLGEQFGPGVKPIGDRLEEIQDEIQEGGGTVPFYWPWDEPGVDGFRCAEADELVQDRLRSVRDTGWEYEHEEHDGWGWFWGDGDHNWGHVYGPNGEEFYIDFWLNEETPILLEPPR